MPDGLLVMLRLLRVVFSYFKGCVCHVMLLGGTTMFSRIGEGTASKHLRRMSPSSTVPAHDGDYPQHDIPLVGRDLTEYSTKILTEPVHSFTGAHLGKLSEIS